MGTRIYCGVFSMKASNPVIMVQAYRLLVAEMYVRGWDYPLHLGVTEAGEGEDGRMKSAIGIGTLLQDGLGDTIRVSITEPPEEEIDPCRKLANLGKDGSHGLIKSHVVYNCYYNQKAKGSLCVWQKIPL
ncbi:4-hydroxy-3-methylbut-2-en-1-yl diphosphate synthase (ferredoxin), chloroplastic-like isoform X2 [Helianthus annuus]|uniref:4-hydroxy-3-methylbut-2-en-1-yl diphosphate synthase (ferredoxin), chloroplastic-like isoform X2 n=1 Tax=Helianthus annuus TaxID=4232 RepID=UPI000B8FAB9C|nr:4-hydroxy-3-methylbut-2-en-1-yl diphosphate synthase (ferredoxin), chloroplastic-like isoform X2 [Helianthus annuus]XP_035844871.1 4-hydroxy-3-methylbut-2-en-1-yl diphosphate synthase (ferredoxin), chloroplastic-like isoform X2 [Helianthus annuus]